MIQVISCRKHVEMNYFILHKHLSSVWCYLVKGVFEKQSKKLYNWKLRTGLYSPQVNTDKQAQKIGELFQVAAGWKCKISRTYIIRHLTTLQKDVTSPNCYLEKGLQKCVLFVWKTKTREEDLFWWLFGVTVQKSDKILKDFYNLNSLIGHMVSKENNMFKYHNCKPRQSQKATTKPCDKGEVQSCKEPAQMKTKNVWKWLGGLCKIMMQLLQIIQVKRSGSRKRMQSGLVKL